MMYSSLPAPRTAACLQQRGLGCGPWRDDTALFHGTLAPPAAAAPRQLPMAADAGRRCVCTQHELFNRQVPGAARRCGAAHSVRASLALCPCVPNGCGGSRTVSSMRGAHSGPAPWAASYPSVPNILLPPRRANYELASGGVLLRSTPFSYCFLEELVRKGTGGWAAGTGDMGLTITLVMLAAFWYPPCLPPWLPRRPPSHPGVRQLGQRRPGGSDDGAGGAADARVQGAPLRRVVLHARVHGVLQVRVGCAAQRGPRGDMGALQSSSHALPGGPEPHCSPPVTGWPSPKPLQGEV